MFTSEMMSTMRRFVSSGRHSSLQRLPASMWKMGMCSRFAPMTDRQLLVSPSTSTASGWMAAIELVALRDDVAHRLAQIRADGVHIDLGVGQLQVVEEHAVQVVVVVLAGVGQDNIKIFATSC